LLRLIDAYGSVALPVKSLAVFPVPLKLPATRLLAQVHVAAKLDDAAVVFQSIAITVCAVISNGDIYQSCVVRQITQTAAITLGRVSADGAVDDGQMTVEGSIDCAAAAIGADGIVTSKRAVLDG
jgi:hypothetical protein